MATLVLQSLGSVAGGAVGGPIGSLVGKTIGSLAASAISGSLLSRGGAQTQSGSRLADLSGLSSQEGAVIPRVYGRARIGGQMIWATRFEEEAFIQRTGKSGAKGGGTSSNSSTASFTYYANFAIGLCEGKIGFVRRVWADGHELDLSLVSMRVYEGTQDQSADPLIIAKEGVENAPAYRGLAYVVFERFALADFGNRIPQLAFEVVRPVGGMASMIKAVNIIPGASEFGYSTVALTQELGPGISRTENRHILSAPSDWIASIDALQALCPNLESVALVVAWFGDDLRVGQCKILPRVERRDKTVLGQTWVVGDFIRGNAPIVSQVDGFQPMVARRQMNRCGKP